MALPDRMERYAAIAAPRARVLAHSFQPSTTRPDRKRRLERRRLRLALGELGSRPRRFEPAADPASTLDRCTERRPGLTLSFEVTPAKNKNAFLQNLSFQKIPSHGTNFTLVARGYGHSAKSSRASRSASANAPKNRGLAFQVIFPRLLRHRIASPLRSYSRRMCATSCRLVRLG